ncbi:hypothetical protein RhiJN_24766 [Ceratobasidium sp. AG-Ba]|nr:hypothetical protein RhiJN_24766 [Ceratobasidium sp. AG-Ba]
MKSFRHRIRAIELEPPTSKCPVSLKLLVDGVVWYHTPELVRGSLLQWEHIPPCDVEPWSRVGIRIYEHYAIFARRCIGSVEYEISAVDISPKALQMRNAHGLLVTVKFYPPEPSKDIAARALSDTGTIQRQLRLLEKLGPARNIIANVLELGSVVAELDPRAKAVFTVFSKAWEKLEAQEKCDASVETLVNGLFNILSTLDTVHSISRLHELRNIIEEMWKLIEDASWFIIEYRSMGETTSTLRALAGINPQEKVDDMLTRLRDLKESFDRGVRVQTLQTVEQTRQALDENVRRMLLGKLNPVAAARFDASRGCMPGTRGDILAGIIEWLGIGAGGVGVDAEERFLWLYGQAGLGKTAIATSTCQELARRRLLSTSFFCKRDSQDRRDPRLVITTIIYDLAVRHSAYANGVLRALEEDPVLPESPMQMLFDKLVLDVLESSQPAPPESKHIVVIDALDECGSKDTRRQLLGCLTRLSQLVSWMKVIVTSRPNPEIKEFFDRSGANIVSTRDLSNYEASNDICMFVHQRIAESMKGNLLAKGSADLISDAASGLFIWAHTACERVLEDIDPPSALKIVLDSTGCQQSQSLDGLYTTVIETSIDRQQRSDARSTVRNSLGAIIMCSTRTPLSIIALSSLLGEHTSVQALQSMVDCLGSVLYIDHSSEDAVRVYHPSFTDYMLTSSRSGVFCVDVEQLNAILAGCCLRVMTSDLRFNICGLESSYKRNDEVLDLQSRVTRAIGSHLRYSCTYWAVHLRDIQQRQHREQQHRLLRDFMAGPTPIFWIEVLSLMGRLNVGISSIRDLEIFYQVQQINLPLPLQDINRLLQTFYRPISESTPHLYVSALAFMPIAVSLRSVQKEHFPNIIRITHHMQREWPIRSLCINHECEVHAVAASFDGCKIASGLNDGTIHIWDASTGAAIAEPSVGHLGRVTCVAFSPDGQRTVSGSFDQELRVWDANTGALVCEPLVGHRDWVTCVAFSWDNQQIVSGSCDATVRVWNANTGVPTSEPFTGHLERVISVAFLSDGKRIISGSYDGRIRLWDASTGSPIGQPWSTHSDRVMSLAFSPDDQSVASGSCDRTVRVCNTGEYAPIGDPLIAHSEWVTSVAFSLDGQQVASSSYDKTVRVWNSKTGAPIGAPFTGHSDRVTSVAFTASDRCTVSGSLDKTVQIWDIGKNESPSQQSMAHYSSWTFTRISQSDNADMSFGLAQSQNIYAAVLNGNSHMGHSDIVMCVAFSPDSQRIVSGSCDRTVRVWNVHTASPIVRPFTGHSNWVTSVAFSPDGRRIVSGSYDKTIRIWDVGTGFPVGVPFTGHLGPIVSIGFSPDGRYILSSSFDQIVHVWDAKTGTPAGQLSAEDLNRLSPSIFSPDRRSFVSGSYDGKVRVWSTQSGALLGKPFEGHSGRVTAVAFSPDGRHIVSGSYDKTIRVWDAKTVVQTADSLSEYCQYAKSSTVSTRAVPVRNVANSARQRDRYPLGPVHTRHHCVSRLAEYCSYDGWISVTPGELLFWLPLDYRQFDLEGDSLLIISREDIRQPAWLDLSHFAHGPSWTEVYRPT